MSDDSSYSKTILVTGAGGQLGMELWKLSERYPSANFLFATKENLPVDNFNQVKSFFENQQVDYCINCAAYTAVDKAELEKQKAFLINADAAGNLATVCKAHQAQLIHISTDYVFDGKAKKPYKEEDRIAPVNVYGASKLRGEELVFNNNPSAVVIRTSWLYSSFGSNFVKTMVRIMKEKSSLPEDMQSINVVSDQYGSPTYAADLATAIMTIVEAGNNGQAHSGIFNYSNAGATTWYDFARGIKKLADYKCTVNPIHTSEYPTPAKRPRYSVLDTTKIKETFNITIPKWKESLEECLTFLI